MRAQRHQHVRPLRGVVLPLGRCVVGGVLVAAFAGCGGEEAATTVGSTERTDTTTVEPEPAGGTLPQPDSEWTAQVIDAYESLLDGDLDRNLEFLDAIDADPEREVEHYVAYLRSLATATSDVIDAFPDIPPDGPVGASAASLRDALTERRDQLDEAAAELDAIADEVQAELDTGDDTRYAEWRSIPADDPVVDACFDLQTKLDTSGLGLLRCLPGPEGDEPMPTSPVPPEVDLGAAAAPVTIELAFDDGDPPTGTFEVVAGDEELGCTEGTWKDTDLSEDMIELTKEFTCREGDLEGTFVVTQWLDGSNAWVVSGANGDFTGLAGAGTSSFDRTATTETMEGEISVADAPPAP